MNMLYEDWLAECEKEFNSFREILKKLDKSQYYVSLKNGRYASTYQYSFDERNVLPYRDALRRNGICHFYDVYFKMVNEKVLVQYPNDPDVEEWNGQEELKTIERFSLLSLREIREMLGMTQAAFSSYLCAPKRTLQNWENGVSECPEHFLLSFHRMIYHDFGEFYNEKKLRYDIVKSTIELPYRDRKSIKEGVALHSEDTVVLDSFLRLSDAQNALGNYRSDISEFSSHSGTCYSVTEYYIQSCTYDADGDFIEGGDVFDFAPFKIDLLEEDSGRILGSFNNMEDAERAYNDYDGDAEVYLKF